MELPTAPFHEGAVRSRILEHLSRMRNVECSVDSFGNVLAYYRASESQPKFMFCAHMDHPAYVGGKFEGGVPASYLEARPPTVHVGEFSVWDLPGFELRENCIYGRACDDLIGCAAILSVFDDLQSRGVEATFMAAFTCAEEVGLLGAIHLCRSGALPEKITVISLETSAERPPAQMHNGVIVRVGDRSSSFHPTVTAQLCDLAKARGINFQRCLMAGGTCEATAFQAYGFDAAGICVALGNYHNCGPGNRIAPEFVSIPDVQNMVQLCTALVQVGELPCPKRALVQRLEEGYHAYVHPKRIVQIPFHE